MRPAREPWKLTSIMWPLIIAALMPIRLSDAAHHTSAIVDRLQALSKVRDLPQVEDFRGRYYRSQGDGAHLN